MSRDDEHDIAKVLVAYAASIDGRDWDRFRTCFTADVEAVYDGVGTWHDVEAIAAFMVEAHVGMGPTLHRLSNLDIAVDGDRASARSYVDAVVLAPDGELGIQTLGTYDDDLIRTDDGWRIARRHFMAVRFDVIGSP